MPAPLLDALFHALLFLEGSDDSVVDPDAAVQVMEYIAGCLQRLTATEFQELFQYLDARAPSADRDRAIAMIEAMGIVRPRT